MDLKKMVEESILKLNEKISDCFEDEEKKEVFLDTMRELFISEGERIEKETEEKVKKEYAGYLSPGDVQEKIKESRETFERQRKEIKEKIEALEKASLTVTEYRYRAIEKMVYEKASADEFSDFVLDLLLEKQRITRQGKAATPGLQNI